MRVTIPPAEAGGIEGLLLELVLTHISDNDGGSNRDGHLWSLLAAGDNRPDVYVGLLLPAKLAPDSTPQLTPRPPPAAEG